MVDRLSFSPNILRRLGEELVPDIDQGILELVKNAYDADATECIVVGEDLMSGQGRIKISDNGLGMTNNQIRNSWLIIGKSTKNKNEKTEHFKRIPVGDKGLGRLSALRLGNQVDLVTRPAAEPGVEYRITLDWDQFESVDVVEDVPLTIQRAETDQEPGTEISIERIEKKITRTTVNKLARSLILLSDPFANLEPKRSPKNKLARESQDDPGFVAILASKEFEDIQKKVGTSYFDDAEYRIHAEVRKDGSAVFHIMDWKGDILHESLSGDTYHCPPCNFDLWNFVLKAESFSTRTSTLSEVRDWLKELGGVSIYEDSIRVPPYGGAENDWLQLNLRRARSPEVRPSTNTAVGRVKLSNVNGELVQKTDRVGYVENFEFSELKRACGDVLDWAAKELLRERDSAKQKEKNTKKDLVEKAEKRLDTVLAKSVSPTERKAVDDAIKVYIKESDRAVDAILDDLQLYRSLATAGMTSAVFAHEVGRPLSLIDRAIKALVRLIPDSEKHKVLRKVSKIEARQKELNSFISIPLKLLSKSKRRHGKIDVNEKISELKALLQPVSDHYETKVSFVPCDATPFINGTETLLHGIVLNLMLNSFSAFQREGFGTEKREIKISTVNAVSGVVFHIEDNAGGIDGVSKEDMWLPGVTTSEDGTGFGLTIVRDSVKDLRGTITVVEKTDFGGAKFSITIPSMRELF